jgi:FSR family fosmidomycin resistance protein-like MFS transporter
MKTTFRVLFALSACHLLNDMMQSLLPAIYPNLKNAYLLSFAQVGLITSTYQLTASLLQPLVGAVTDRRPLPFSLAAGTLFTILGLLLLSRAASYPALLVGACALGLGSSVFHPESSRVAHMAAGPRRGFAQSLFQVGGNTGTALGPVCAATVVMWGGQGSLALFSILMLVSTALLVDVGRWYKRRGLPLAQAAREHAAAARPPLPPRAVTRALVVLLALIFSKYLYLASYTSYFTFYVIHRFGVSVQAAQFYLALFQASVAAGTLAGGPLGDRFGRKRVIWFSIAGALPFALVLPWVGLFWTGVLSAVIGFVLASAFPAIVVYGQELVPNKLGMISGLFFGFAFGVAGMGAALLGRLVDATSIEFVYRACSFLPALGLLAAALPDLRSHARPTRRL